MSFLFNLFKDEEKNIPGDVHIDTATFTVTGIDGKTQFIPGDRFYLEVQYKIRGLTEDKISRFANNLDQKIKDNYKRCFTTVKPKDANKMPLFYKVNSEITSKRIVEYTIKMSCLCYLDVPAGPAYDLIFVGNIEKMEHGLVPYLMDLLDILDEVRNEELKKYK